MEDLIETIESNEVHKSSTPQLADKRENNRSAAFELVSNDNDAEKAQPETAIDADEDQQQTPYIGPAKE